MTTFKEQIAEPAGVIALRAGYRHGTAMRNTGVDQNVTPVIEQELAAQEEPDVRPVRT